MSTFIALLRAVNVGGTGKLPMSDLRAMCTELGFENVTTYIASGNVVFTSKLREHDVKAKLEKRLRTYAGKDVAVFVRTAEEMSAVLERCPHRHVPGNFAYVIFLDEAPPPDTIAKAVARVDEEIVLGPREIYVLYPNGAGRSTLRIPAAKSGTARNMNTVAKLTDLAAGISASCQMRRPIARRP
jgi:uncharacterized protein (DUF1697 family)